VVERLNNYPGNIPEDDPLWDMKYGLEDKICTTPTVSPDAALAQLEFATNECAGFEIQNNFASNWDGQLFESVMNSLRAMAGKA
jgi:hypothetical protein